MKIGQLEEISPCGWVEDCQLQFTILVEDNWKFFRQCKGYPARITNATFASNKDIYILGDFVYEDNANGGRTRLVGSI